ncbi:vacuolar protein sorting-associated protein 13, partial [Hamiltosporidium tvaerminnensis]
GVNISTNEQHGVNTNTNSNPSTQHPFNNTPFNNNNNTPNNNNNTHYPFIFTDYSLPLILTLRIGKKVLNYTFKQDTIIIEGFYLQCTKINTSYILRIVEINRLEVLNDINICSNITVGYIYKVLFEHIAISVVSGVNEVMCIHLKGTEINLKSSKECYVSINDKSEVGGVNYKDSRKGVNYKSELGGVSNSKDIKLEGVNDKSNKLEGVSNKDNKLEGVINSKEQHPLNNNNISTNKQHPYNNSTNTQHPLNNNNISTNKQHPLNTNTNLLNNTPITDTHCCLDISIISIQIDNQTLECVYPIIFYPVNIKQRFFSESKDKRKFLSLSIGFYLESIIRYLTGDNNSSRDVEGVSNGKDVLEGVNDRRDGVVGVNDKYSNIKGVNNNTNTYNPLNNSTNTYNPLNNSTDKQHPLNSSTDKQHPLNSSTDNYNPLNNTTNTYNPLNNTTNTYHPLNNTTNTYNPLNNSTSYNPLNNSTSYNPLNNTTNTYNPLNNTTNTYHPLNNTTNTYHPLNNSTDNYNPLNNTTNTQHPNTPPHFTYIIFLLQEFVLNLEEDILTKLITFIPTYRNNTNYSYLLCNNCNKNECICYTYNSTSTKYTSSSTKYTNNQCTSTNTKYTNNQCTNNQYTSTNTKYTNTNNQYTNNQYINNQYTSSSTNNQCTNNQYTSTNTNNQCTNNQYINNQYTNHTNTNQHYHTHYQQHYHHNNITIDTLHLHPLKLRFSFLKSTKNHFISYLLSFILQNISSLKLKFNTFLITNIKDYKILIELIINSYKIGLISQMYKIFGSLDFLGNLSSLVDSFSLGVHDLFYEPYNVLSNSNSNSIDFSIGILRGGKSFIKNTLSGVSNTVSRVTSSISKGVSLVSLDKDFNEKMNLSNNLIFYLDDELLFPDKLVFTNKYDRFVESCVSGVRGIVEKPMEGFKKGFRGFLVGVGKGIVGAVAKPVAGISDLACSVSEGVRDRVSGGEVVRIQYTRV